MYEREIAFSLNAIGDLSSDLGNKSSARPAYQEALALFRRLALDNPRTYSRYVAQSLNGLGLVLSDLMETKAALEAFSEALQIRRELVKSEPETNKDLVAHTLHNLGTALSELNQKQAAREAYEEAVTIYRSLSDLNASSIRESLALSLNNLGNVLSDLNRKRQAVETLTESLAIRRSLVEADPRSLLQVAHTLNSLGSVLSFLNENQSAIRVLDEALLIFKKRAASGSNTDRAHVAATLNNRAMAYHRLNINTVADVVYRESLLIYRELAKSDRKKYRSYVATTLNNHGIVLSGSNEKSAARQTLTEAATIYRELAESEPKVYLLHVATALNNLGNVLRDVNDLRGAREVFEEADRIHSSLAPSLSSALVTANLSMLEGVEGGEFCDRALHLARSAVRTVEGLLSKLSQSEYPDRHAFKRQIEPVYLTLLRFNSNPDVPGDCRELPPLLEALRRSELLSLEAPLPRMRTSSWEDVVSGEGALADSMRDQHAVFVWIQIVGREMIFVILQPGIPLQVERTEKTGTDEENLIDAFESLIDESRSYFDHPSLAAEARKAVEVLAAQCARLLPGRMRDLLFGNKFHTIFLAPCGRSSLFPWEILHLNGDYVALRKVVARTHGLGELEEVLNRQPVTQSAVIVGNPQHEAAIDLPAAGTQASALWKHLREHGWKIHGGVWAENELLGEAATLEKLVEWLRREPRGLFVLSTHGRPMSVLLERNDELTDITLTSVGLQGNPIVHFDCCWAGINLGTGGGRYLGMPIAALQAIASAVIASSHPLYDAPAAQFNRVLYEALIDGGLCLGDAVIQARKALKGNPLHWATTVLWGNPQVRLHG